MDKKIVVYRYVGDNGEITTINAFFKEDKLVVEGCDTGSSVKAFSGDRDDGYWLSADRKACPGNILEILKGGFRSFTGIKAWFDEQQIDYDVISYA
ncbi:hypothetical protein [Desulfoluna spongiiphila]|uniref:Uncharacterized protein n=1 Tax=Desulfoluna spongiiphila TaxID=419481 RepID=A0A1G5BKB2_9BACT|nr:hypothetical protein [Desulfoluna spongiiphila]SCX90536.1 hypothetical protein SAMN05216233_10263 [Desulfoluna spongiiphila]VVS93780.1 hypothetical protein DBB_33520 [Desulfoluna spongiiphila]